MDPEDRRRELAREGSRAFSAWLAQYLNRPQVKIELSDLPEKARLRALYEVDCLEHMWALPEREEP